jgi:hypothetical protein
MSDGQTQPSTPPGASDEPSAEIPNPEDDEAIVTTDIGATGPALNTLTQRHLRRPMKRLPLSRIRSCEQWPKLKTSAAAVSASLRKPVNMR